MNEQLALLDVPARPEAPAKPAARPRSRFLFNPKEYKVQALRECPTPAEMQLCDTPDKAVAWHPSPRLRGTDRNAAQNAVVGHSSFLVQ